MRLSEDQRHVILEGGDAQEMLYGAPPLTADVLDAVALLNHQNRTTNNSQIARIVGISGYRVRVSTEWLRRHGYIKDTGGGAAYHWRLKIGSPAVTLRVVYKPEFRKYADQPPRDYTFASPELAAEFRETYAAEIESVEEVGR